MRKKNRFLKAMISLVSSACLLTQGFTAFAGEQLGQTDFENGAGLPWHVCETDPAELEFEIDNGVYKITILNPGGASRGGEDRWDCQFRHRGLKIVSGHQYKVSYEITATNSGRYYTKIGNLDGDLEIWHNNSTGAHDFDSNWDLMHISANQTKKVELTFTASQSLDVAEWAFHFGGDGQYTSGDCFPVGTVITFDNMSLIDLTSDENDFVPVQDWVRSEVLTNQVGYFTDRAKKATLLSSDKKSVKFEVLDENGKKAFSGKSEYFGYDEDSGDSVHILDFTELNKDGTYYIETADGAKSREFTVGGSDIYSSMLYDSLNYFYQNRSGIQIESQLITSGDTNALARAAGHTSDVAQIQHTWGYTGSGGSQDVSGGWYDAGDHGKYVVNGGISLWLMQNQYETAKKYGFEDVYADGTMNVPENANGYPDLLDEARWEMEWMLKMMVKDGDYEGMVYHKVHDAKWTALGIAPANAPSERVIKPPTTQATLNLAACAAQSARLWKGIDDTFANTCLEAAKKAYAAAQKHPEMYAPLDEAVGGGAYGDNDATDEFYWAACELFATTGDTKYYDDAKNSDYFLTLSTSLTGGESVDTVGSFDWGHTSALGSFTIALNDDVFSKNDIKTVTENIEKASEYFINLEAKQGYGVPLGQSKISYADDGTGYVWGSNSFVSDNSVVMAYAYLLTGDEKHLDGVISGVDYLLGRNPMDYSYVTGYGSHAVQFPHHRYWAEQIDSTFPKAPCGILVGGPNSGMEDPWVRGFGWKKGEIAPQKAYLDHIEAWSVNECTINWNASLAWLISFTAEENGGITVGSTGVSSGIVNDGGNGTSNENPIYEEVTTPAKTTEKDSPSAKGEDNSVPANTNNSDNSSDNTLTIVLVVGAVIVLVSIEILIYKIMKMKNKG